MIICYGESDVSGKPPAVSPLNETIVVFKHHRNADYNRAIVAKHVEKVDNVPTTKGYLHRHYCPFKRIFNALQDYCLGKRRIDIILWIFSDDPFNSSKQCVVTHLDLQPSKEAMDMFKAVGSPFNSLVAFDCFLEWAFYSICDWPENVFYGTGIGDGKGTKLDIPTTPGYADRQKLRVAQALQKLAQVIPGLSMENVVSVEKYAKIYRASGAAKLREAIEISSMDDIATSSAQVRLKPGGPPIDRAEMAVEEFDGDIDPTDHDY